jgi:hypothetical protein
MRDAVPVLDHARIIAPLARAARQGDDAGMPFRSLDFVYTPSQDVPGDVRYFVDVLGAELDFAIEAMGTKVAMVRLAPGTPAILLTDHLEGDRPVLVYRVDRLQDALAELEGRGWVRESTLELPPGPACSFRTPGGHRIAIYESSRPGVVDSFAGRRDF